MIEGGCYCGAIRFRIDGDQVRGGQCHCRPCQHITGGAPNLFALIDPDIFAYTKGTPATFARPDLPNPVTREFCGTCGTHLTSIRPGLPQRVVKIGTFDDPAIFGGPGFAIFTCDAQAFHQIPDGIPAFETIPDRAR